MDSIELAGLLLEELTTQTRGRAVAEYKLGFNVEVTPTQKSKVDAGLLLTQFLAAPNKISGIKLLRALNPGMGLREAKIAFETSSLWRRIE